MKLTAFSCIALLVSGSALASADPGSSAHAIVAAAEARAAKRGSNVMVIFHASWCGWCHKLDGFLTSRSFGPTMAANFEIVHIDVSEHLDKKSLETPGGAKLSTAMGADNQGLPFYVILDPRGKVLADSKNKGANIGYPSAPEEVTHFMKVLHKTAKHLSPSQADGIEAFLRAKQSPAG